MESYSIPDYRACDDFDSKWVMDGEDVWSSIMAGGDVMMAMKSDERHKFGI